MKLHISLHQIHMTKADDIRYELEVYTQPTWRRAIAKFYHWYDMRVFKVPGFKVLEDWLWSKHEDEFLYLPLGCQQDIRCYDLSVAGRKVVARVKITKEQYDNIQASRRGVDPSDSV